MGSMQELAFRLGDRVPQSRQVGLVYPASVNNPLYDDSVDEGAETLREMIMDYVEACPGRRIALLGNTQVCRPIGRIQYQWLTMTGRVRKLSVKSSAVEMEASSATSLLSIRA
jgi:hypothetical protein